MKALAGPVAHIADGFVSATRPRIVQTADQFVQPLDVFHDVAADFWELAFFNRQPQAYAREQRYRALLRLTVTVP